MRAVFTHITGVKRGQREVLPDEQISVGRSPGNTLAFAPTDTRASAHHAEIHFDGAGYVLRDSGSTNGTFVNGQRVYHARLKPGDVIEFGTGGPQVQFATENDGGGPVQDLVPRTETMEVVRRQSGAHLAPGKEYGRTTMRLMVDYAVRKSSMQFRVMVAALVALVLGLSALTMFLGYKAWSAASLPGDFRAIAKQNQGAVVFIYVRFTLLDEKGDAVEEDASTGSGFVVDPEGYVVTNRHVIRLWEYDPTWKKRRYTGQIREIKVIFADHNSDDTVPAEIVRVSDSEDLDIAILKVSPFEGMPVLTNFNRDASTLSQGDAVAVLGYPLGADLFQFTHSVKAETSLSQGVISRVTADKIQIDAAANPGNSGGPVFDRRGRVIAILTQGLASMGAQNINFGTPVGYALDMLEQTKAVRSQPGK